MAQWSPVPDGCPIVTECLLDYYLVSFEAYLCITQNKYCSLNISLFQRGHSIKKSVLQPCLVDAEPAVRGVPATEGALTEVGVRGCRLGVPFVESLSSCGTGVLGGLIGLDMIEREIARDNLIPLFQSVFRTPRNLHTPLDFPRK